MKNPIINSPYKEPTRHFKADEHGISDEVLEFRRPSTRYVSAMPRTRKRDRQLTMNLAEGALSAEMQEDNEFINKVRFIINEWRKKEYPGITKTSRDLLYYWRDDGRENKLFFCQIEAMETLIYINEVAEKAGETWIPNELKKANNEANPGLYRLAFKMATGSGKTVVMAMIIAYNTLNKIRYPQDTRFTDAFAIITPGITIRDRLQVLEPNNSKNYYLQRDIVSHQDFELLQGAVVFITNFHQLGLRDNQRFAMGGTLKATKLIKEEVAKESPNAMVNRAFKSLLTKARVLVINDEAHHCYREKPTDEKLKGDDLKEANENNEAARVWINGLEALAKKMKVNAVIDLSATPYFLRGSGYEEGKLFTWTVYDFSLLDALECGVVKIPRLPVESDTIKQSEMPEFRNLWDHISDDTLMPKKGLKKVAVAIGPEFGSVDDDFIRDAVTVAKRFADLLVVAATSFDASAHSEPSQVGDLRVMKVKINPDLSMGDLLKKTGSGNLFLAFGEPEIKIHYEEDPKGFKKPLGPGSLTVEILGVDVYDPVKSEIRTSGSGNPEHDIAAWFIDTNYNGEAFFVTHAYFLGADKPYEKLKKALKADINEDLWEELYSTTSRPFPKPKTGRIAVKVINHYGDEVMKVVEVR